MVKSFFPLGNLTLGSEKSMSSPLILSLNTVEYNFYTNCTNAFNLPALSRAYILISIVPPNIASTVVA